MKLAHKYDITDSLYFTIDDRGQPRQVGAPQAGLQETVTTVEGIARQTKGSVPSILKPPYRGP